MKAAWGRAGAGPSAGGDGLEELPYEQLRSQLEERTGEVEVGLVCC